MFMKHLKVHKLTKPYLVLIFNKHMINNIFMLQLMIVMNLLFKILMKISLFLINLTMISLLRRIINRSLMIYLSKLILHLITMETMMLKIMNKLLYFPLKYVDVMGQQMIIVDSSHKNIVREIK
jgi:hypothetical protein